MNNAVAGRATKEIIQLKFARIGHPSDSSNTWTAQLLTIFVGNTSQQIHRSRFPLCILKIRHHIRPVHSLRCNLEANYRQKTYNLRWKLGRWAHLTKSLLKRTLTALTKWNEAVHISALMIVLEDNERSRVKIFIWNFKTISVEILKIDFDKTMDIYNTKHHQIYKTNKKIEVALSWKKLRMLVLNQNPKCHKTGDSHICCY